MKTTASFPASSANNPEQARLLHIAKKIKQRGDALLEKAQKADNTEADSWLEKDKVMLYGDDGWSQLDKQDGTIILKSNQSQWGEEYEYTQDWEITVKGGEKTYKLTTSSDYETTEGYETLEKDMRKLAVDPQEPADGHSYILVSKENSVAGRPDLNLGIGADGLIKLAADGVGKLWNSLPKVRFVLEDSE